MAITAQMYKQTKHYEVFRLGIDDRFNITERSNKSAMDDVLIAEKLSEEEMWAMVKLLSQPSMVRIDTTRRVI